MRPLIINSQPELRLFSSSKLSTQYTSTVSIVTVEVAVNPSYSAVMINTPSSKGAKYPSCKIMPNKGLSNDHITLSVTYSVVPSSYVAITSKEWFVSVSKVTELGSIYRSMIVATISSSISDELTVTFTLSSLNPFCT